MAGFFSNVSRFAGNLTGGVIGESDAERRRKEAERRAAAQRAAQAAASRPKMLLPTTSWKGTPPPQPPQAPQNRAQAVQLPSQKADPFSVNTLRPQAPKPKLPVTEAPRVNVADMVARVQAANNAKPKTSSTSTLSPELEKKKKMQIAQLVTKGKIYNAQEKSLVSDKEREAAIQKGRDLRKAPEDTKSFGWLANATADSASNNIIVDTVRKPFKDLTDQVKVTQELRSKGIYDASTRNFPGRDKETAKIDQAIKEAEKKTGVEYDPVKGLAALAETGLNATDLTGIRGALVRGGKKVLGITGKTVTDIVKEGRNLAEDGIEAVNTARTDRIDARRDEEILRQNQANADEAIRLGEERAATAENLPAVQRPRPIKDEVVDAPKTLDVEQPTYQYKAAQQAIVRQAEDELNRVVNAKPDITPEQMEVLQAAARAKTIERLEELRLARENAKRVGDEAAEAQAKVVDDAVEATTPNPVETPTTPIVGNAAGDIAANRMEQSYLNNKAETELLTPDEKARRTELNTPPPATGDVPLPDEAVDDLDYMGGQQGLERLAGNKTLEDITGAETTMPRMEDLTAGGSATLQGGVDTVADASTSFLGRMTGKALRSQNRVLNSVGQLFYGLNQKATLATAEKTMVEQLLGRTGGQKGLMNDIVTKMDEPLSGLDEAGRAAARERVFDVMSKVTDARKFNDPAARQQAAELYKTLSPEELAYMNGIQEANILVNRLNTGLLSDEVLRQGADGMHMPRIYDMDTYAKEMGFANKDEMVKSWVTARGNTLDLNPQKERKQIDEISEQLQALMLRDPAQAVAIRAEIALHNRAVRDYADQVTKIDGAVSNGNLRGYLPVPDHPKFGALAGQHVRKDLADKMLTGADRFESQAYQKVSALFDQFQASALGKVEAYLRQALTVFNPATRAGNRGANITMSQLAGFNVPEMAWRQQHYISTLGNGGDEMTRLAQSYGAIDNGNAMSRFSGVQNSDPSTWVGRRQESYQNVDDGAKVAMFEWQLKKNGGDPVAAARFVNRALPNIGNSGEIYRFFSRLPILGVPFRAIQPEVMRALASNATRHSVPFVTALAAYTTFQNWTWDEIPEEERAQIQERFGAGRTPFAKLNDFVENKTGVQTDKVLPSTWSFNAGKFTKMAGANDENVAYEVDPRRLMGMYSINTSDTEAGGALDEVKKIAPMPVPVKLVDGKLSFQPQEVVGSRTFQPIWNALIDRDFRGKSIQDPEGKIYNPDGTTSLKFVDPETLQPTAKSDVMRSIQSIGRSWVPQANDIANIYDASKGNETFLGQEMSVPQSILRVMGLKGERFDQTRLQDMRDTNAYFDDRKEIDAEAAAMSPSAAEAYKRASGYYKLREEVPNEFSPGDMRNKKAPVYNFTEDKWKDISSNPQLYDLLRNKKVRDAQRSGTPIQPEFDDRLSDAFRKQMVANKSVAPGDNAELDQRMYEHPEWDTYMALKEEYKAAAAKYYPQSGEDDFTDELVKNNNAKFPPKPEAYKAYTDAYNAYNAGKGEKPAFTDEVAAVKEAYETSKLNWTNNERLKRGLPPIPRDMWDNATFGYTPAKKDSYSKGGYGGGSGGGDYQNDFGKLGFISDLANSGGDVEDAPRARKFKLDTSAIQAAQKVSRGSGRKITMKA